MKLHVAPLLLALSCSALGLATGLWLIPHHEHTPPTGAAADPNEETHYDAATVESLGIATTSLVRGTFRIERAIAATVDDLPTARRELHAPIGGIVLEVAAHAGTTVPPGSVLLRMQRAAIPPVRLELTREHVFPNHDEIHAAFGALRSAEIALATDRDEVERLRALESATEDAPLLPRQRAIELGYAMRRNEAAAQQARHELERHGFTEEQIEAVLSDREAALFDGAHARRALQHAGMWSDAAQALLDALPEATRSMPLVVGTIAELVALGHADDALVQWLRNSPADAARFPTIASLLLGGQSTPAVMHLAALGALDEIVELRAPELDGAWDVVDVSVRPGVPVTDGAVLLTLRDPRRMRLIARPLGSEVAPVQAAFRSATACRARAVPAGTAPDLDDLHVLTLQSEPSGPVAWFDLDNLEIRGADADSSMRSWALQPGQHYELLLPVDELRDTWIVPTSAIVERGAQRIVFIAEAGGHFHPQPVIVVAEGAGRAAIRGPSDGPCELVDGCPIVTAGGYALALAMRGDAAAEHHHDH